MLTFSRVSIGTGATHSGPNCAPDAEHEWRPSSDVALDIARVVGESDVGSGPNISLGGAEPLAYSGLQAVLRFARQEGVKRVRLETDCAGLRTEQDAAVLLEAGVRHICFTLLGADAESHDRLVGRRGAYDAGVQGLGRFTAAAESLGAPIHLTCRVPICRAHIHALPAVVSTAASLGFACAHLEVVDPVLDLSSASPWIEAACDTGMVNEMWVDVEGVPFGFASGWELHLACVYRPVQGEKAAKCSGCALDGVCGGAVRGAPDSVLATLREPQGAERIAEKVARSYAAPGGGYA